MDCSPHDVIAAAIAKKAADRLRYENLARQRFRLLLVADRINNSGKPMPENETEFDLHGFGAGCFSPYPEVIVLRNESELITQ